VLGLRRNRVAEPDVLNGEVVGCLRRALPGGRLLDRPDSFGVSQSSATRKRRSPHHRFPEAHTTSDYVSWCTIKGICDNMGSTAALVTERDEERDVVHDPGNVLHRLLPSADDKSSHILRYIDWYGVTLFNRLQIGAFIEEWRTLYSKAWSEEAQSILNRIEQCAQKVQDGVHLYLKFIGD